MAASGIVRLYRDGPPGQPLARLDLDPADFQSDLPEQHWHVAFEDPERGLTVGVWTTTDMQEAFGPYPGDEFMILLEGQVAILDADSTATTIRAGEAFLVRNASPVSWKQVGSCRKFFVIHDPPGAPVQADGDPVVILDPIALEAALTPSDPAASRTGFARRDATGFVNAAGDMRAGLCDGGAPVAQAGPSTCHKLIWIRSGTVDVTEEGGVAQRFGAGDVFFVPVGTVCGWHPAGEVRFVHCTIDAGGAAG